VRDRVLEFASSDQRVVAGAVVGLLALGDGDRWSDLDLTFAVADDVSVRGGRDEVQAAVRRGRREAVRRTAVGGYGRGFDALPADVRDGFAAALMRSLARDELLRVLCVAVDGLLREAEKVRELAAKVEPQLRVLAAE